MDTRRFVFLLLLSQASFLGCHHPCHKVWNNVCRTVKREPKCFDYCDRSQVFHEMACCYWSKNMESQTCSPHFKSGFLDGFADYLHRGGSLQAPVLPPRRYWEPSNSVNRQNVIGEWRTGFQAGAESAQESGMREQIVMSYDGVPVSDTGNPHVQPVSFGGFPSQLDASIVPAQIGDATAPVPAEGIGATYVYDDISVSTIDQDIAKRSISDLPAVEQHNSPETIIHLSDGELGE